MATTPTYSWPIPDDTDLVKDGAEAIRDLGNAIDTTVDGLGVGLVHIETRTITASSSESFNNVFSATYDNYRLIIELVGSTNVNLNFRFRVGGSDDSTGNYRRQRLSADGTSVTGARTTGASSYGLLFTSTNRSSGIVEIANPSLTLPTAIINLPIMTYNGSPQLEVSGGGFSATTIFDGFSLLPETGNITGTLRVYGYQN